MEEWNSDENSKTKLCNIAPDDLHCVLKMGEQQKNNKNKEIRKSFLKRGEGLKKRFKMDPDKFRLNNLPRYTYASNKLKTASNIKIGGVNNQQEQQLVRFPASLLDVKEARFRQLLLTENRKDTINNYTPDLNMLLAKSTAAANQLNTPTKTYLPLSWAQVFDSSRHMSATASVNNNNAAEQCRKLDDSLCAFELIEKKVMAMEKEFQLFEKNLSNSLNSLTTADIITVDKYVQKTGLRPAVKTVTMDESSIESNNSSSEDDNEDMPKEHQFHEENYTHKEYHFEHHSSDTDTDTDKKQPYNNDDSNRVDNVNKIVEEFNSDDGNENENDRDEFRDITLFEHFKQALFLALKNRADEHVYMEDMEEEKEKHISNVEDNQLMSGKLEEDEVCDNNIKKNNSHDGTLLKKRMTELDDAICTFNDNNLELIKSRQQFECEKLQLNRKYEEMLEKLNDERMQFEINMHDEHLKLEKEKQKIVQQQRIQQQSNSKECKEKAAMQIEMNELKELLKQKELNHSAAQARLRTQVRNLEKEQRQLTEKIVQLTKQNKKLQVENMLITRETNNKMLQEINRNIARLATKSKPILAGEFPTATLLKCKQPQAIEIKNKLKSSYPQVIDEKEHRVENEKICNKIKLKKNCDDERVTNSADEVGHKLLKNNINFKNNNNTRSQENSSVINSEFKREIINKDGSKDIWYPNGNLKKISADGMNIRMLYFNKDIKETNINDGMVKYYYAASNIWHTTYLDGLEILEFPNGQTEHRHKNGTIEVHFSNNSIKLINPKDDENLEEWRLADGTNIIKKRNGDKILVLPNGQREVHTKLCKRREYPDGTVKLIYPDGSTESRYSNGRIRLKDKAGNLIMDNASI